MLQRFVPWRVEMPPFHCTEARACIAFVSIIADQDGGARFILPHKACVSAHHVQAKTRLAEQNLAVLR